QTGCESYRHSGLSLLDAEDEAAAQKKWEPTSTSRNSRLPQPRQTQTQRLSPLYPGGCRRSGPSSVSGRRLSADRLAVLRFLAENHPLRYPALRVGRRHRAAPAPTRISLE